MTLISWKETDLFSDYFNPVLDDAMNFEDILQGRSSPHTNNCLIVWANRL